MILHPACNKEKKRPLIIKAQDNTGLHLSHVKIFVQNEFLGETNRSGDFIMDIPLIPNEKIKIEMLKEHSDGYYAPFYQTVFIENPVQEKIEIKAILYSVPKLLNTELKKNLAIKIPEYLSQKYDLPEPIFFSIKNEIIKKSKKIEINKSINLKINTFFYRYQWTHALKNVSVFINDSFLGKTDHLGRFSKKLQIKEDKISIILKNSEFTDIYPVSFEKKKDSIFIEKTFFSKIPENPKIGIFVDKMNHKESKELIYNLIESAFYEKNPIHKVKNTEIANHLIEIKKRGWQDTELNARMDALLTVEELDNYLNFQIINNKGIVLFQELIEIKTAENQIKNIATKIKSNFPYEGRIVSFDGTEGIVQFPQPALIKPNDSIIVYGSKFENNEKKIFDAIADGKILSVKNNSSILFKINKKHNASKIQIGDLVVREKKESYTQYLKSRHTKADLFLRHYNLPEEALKIFSDLKHLDKKHFFNNWIYEGISNFFAGEKFQNINPSISMEYYEKSIKIFNEIENKIDKKTNSYDIIKENIFFHRALADQRLWEITQNIQFVKNANEDWKSFLYPQNKKIYLKEYLENAKKYYKYSSNLLQNKERGHL